MDIDAVCFEQRGGDAVALYARMRKGAVVDLAAAARRAARLEYGLGNIVLFARFKRKKRPAREVLGQIAPILCHSAAVFKLDRRARRRQERRRFGAERERFAASGHARDLFVAAVVTVVAAFMTG
ncbi:hypothetical protein SDC9_115223 [bioreactor metagenome]|uniref:Uncharacterized protein n=1 Tax=bioreactor metagenome TaxID=1076179 RepID=A0A645BSS8_9ZZZZ